MGVKFDSPAESLKARLELISRNFGIVYCIEVKLVWNLLRCKKHAILFLIYYNIVWPL